MFDRKEIVAFFSAVLMLMTALLFNYVDEQASILQTGLILTFTIVLYIALVGIYAWFQLKVKKYDTFILKMEHAVDTLLDSKRFIEDEILSVIEEKAGTIWVITTKLATELNVERTRKSVEKNLSEGKKYVYFLPHKDNSHFGITIERNLDRFKKLELYQQYHSQIEFIRLPLETHFLLEEVVIYNPSEDERDSEFEGINGFSYYEAKAEDGKGLKNYHMKIEGEMLKFQRDRLQTYLSKYGLNNSVQRILLGYAKHLNANQIHYLGEIISCQEIENISEYDSFTSSLKENEGSKKIASSIISILNPYIKTK